MDERRRHADNLDSQLAEVRTMVEAHEKEIDALRVIKHRQGETEQAMINLRWMLYGNGKPGDIQTMRADIDAGKEWRSENKKLPEYVAELMSWMLTTKGSFLIVSALCGLVGTIIGGLALAVLVKVFHL